MAEVIDVVSWRSGPLGGLGMTPYLIVSRLTKEFRGRGFGTGGKPFRCLDLGKFWGDVMEDGPWAINRS